jgi:nicotinamide riboside kinase
LFCDTDTFVTAVFHEVYLGERNAELEGLVEPRRYALYLLCDVDTPFHRDRLGLRREDARREMHERYAEYVRDLPSVELRGSPDERLMTAVEAVDALP